MESGFHRNHSSYLDDGSDEEENYTDHSSNCGDGILSDTDSENGQSAAAAYGSDKDDTETGYTDYSDEVSRRQRSVSPHPPRQQFEGKFLGDLSPSDVLGKFFNTLTEAAEFMQSYSDTVGFPLRKDDIDRDSDKNLIMRRWVCARAGFRSKKHVERTNRKREARNLTRCGCLAAFRVNFSRQLEGWEFREFQPSHNHSLVIERERQFIISNRFIPDEAAAMARALRTVGVKTTQIYDFMALQAGGLSSLRFTRQDLQNRVDADNKLDTLNGDAQAALAFLLGQAARDPGFYYKYTTDAENRLQHLLWFDSISKMDYNCFGEVILFDSTYRKNYYKKPLVVIVGVNHHWKTNVYAFGLLADETEETYSWVLSTFLDGMGGKKPVCVITDGDKSMRKAIRNVLPTSVHRLCSWHLYRNAVSNLKDKRKAQAFRDCMFIPETEVDFMNAWNSFVERFGLEENSWTTQAFRKRHLWAEYNFKGKFFARMTTNQRCESMNAYLKHFLQRTLKLYEFVEQIDRAVARVRHTECHDDYDSKHSSPMLQTHLKELERHAAEVLTRRVFNKLREQLLAEQYLSIRSVNATNGVKTYTIISYRHATEEWDVKLHTMSMEMDCSCLCFESVGLPCAHLFAVMKFEKFRTIPDYLLLNRWRINAKSNSTLGTTSTHQSSELNRSTSSYGALNAVTQKINRFAYVSPQAYSFAINEMTQVATKLEDMVQAIPNAASTRAATSSQTPIICDPEIVQTKGAKKTSKAKPRRPYKCKLCLQGGHNSQTCPRRPTSSTMPSDQLNNSQDASTDEENDAPLFDS